MASSLVNSKYAFMHVLSYYDYRHRARALLWLLSKRFHAFSFKLDPCYVMCVPDRTILVQFRKEEEEYWSNVDRIMFLQDFLFFIYLRSMRDLMRFLKSVVKTKCEVRVIYIALTMNDQPVKVKQGITGQVIY